MSVIKELKVSNLDHVTNKSAFLCSLIKSQRQKLKARVGCFLENGETQPKGPNEEKIKARIFFSLIYIPGISLL